MLDVADLDRHVDPPHLVVNRRLDVPDVRVDAGNLRTDVSQNSLAILDLNRQPDGVGGPVLPLVPLDRDPAFRVVQQIQDVRAGRRVNGDPLAAGHVADNLFAANRVAAARPEDHQIVDAVDGDLVVAVVAEHTADDRRNPAFGRRFLELLLRKEFREDVLRRKLAVAERGIELVSLAEAVLGEHAGHGVRLGERLDVEPETLRFLVEQLPSQLEAALFLFRVDVVLDLVARPRRHHEVEPVAARLVARRGHDFDDVAVA